MADRDKLKAQMAPVGRKELKEVPANLPGPVLTTGVKFLSGVVIKRADGGQTIQLNFSSTQEARQVFTWYETQLRGGGWKVMETETRQGGPGWVIGSKKAQTFVNVHFTSNTGNKKNPVKGCAYSVTINQTKQSLEENKT